MSTLNTLFSSGYNYIKNLFVNGKLSVTNFPSNVSYYNFDCTQATYAPTNNNLTFNSTKGTLQQPIYFTSGQANYCNSSVISCSSIILNDNGETLPLTYFMGKVTNNNTNKSWWNLSLGGNWYDYNLKVNTDLTEAYTLSDNYPILPKTFAASTVNSNKNYITGSSNVQCASKVYHYITPNANTSLQRRHADNKIVFGEPVHMKLAWNNNSASDAQMTAYCDYGSSNIDKEFTTGMINTMYFDYDSFNATDTMTREGSCIIVGSLYVPFHSDKNFYCFHIVNCGCCNMTFRCDFYLKKPNSYQYENVGKPIFQGASSGTDIPIGRNSARTFILGSDNKLYCVQPFT